MATLTQIVTSKVSRVRIAYFVMAHRHPHQLSWLIEAIAPFSPLVLLHVDLKSLMGLKEDRKGIWSTAQRLAKAHPSVRLMRPRFTNWGGWSLSQLLLDAIDHALDADTQWEYFVNLSGQDYPIKHPEALQAQLSQSDRQAFVEMQPFATLPSTDWHLRWHGAFETPLKAFPIRWPRQPPSDFVLDAKGAQWVMLPRAFCEWQRHAPERRRVVRYLRRHFLTDELVIQSLVNNSPWRDRRAPHHLREILWPGHTLTMEDWERLMASPGYFARKFDMAIDPDLTPRMAAHLNLPPPAR